MLAATSCVGGILSEFPSAVEAVEAAYAILEVLKGRNLELSADRRMDFRIGINLGDVIEEADGTIYGDGVNIAARIDALAEPGAIVVSDVVQGVLRGHLDIGFADAGTHEVKNVAEPGIRSRRSGK